MAPMQVEPVSLPPLTFSVSGATGAVGETSSLQHYDAAGNSLGLDSSPVMSPACAGKIFTTALQTPLDSATTAPMDVTEEDTPPASRAVGKQNEKESVRTNCSFFSPKNRMKRAILTTRTTGRESARKKGQHTVTPTVMALHIILAFVTRSETALGPTLFVSPLLGIRGGRSGLRHSTCRLTWQQRTPASLSVIGLHRPCAASNEAMASIFRHHQPWPSLHAAY